MKLHKKKWKVTHDMTEPTGFDKKVAILSTFWLNYKEEEDFEDFVEYNDIGLPLSFMIEEDIVKSTPVAEAYINEAWGLLCAALNINEGQSYDSLEDMFMESGAQD